MRFAHILGQSGTTAAIDRPVLDEHEQELAITASMEAHNDIIALGEEADRMEDVATGLENLAFVADQIQTASKIELGLIDVAGDLAFAGTGVSAEGMTPSLESSEGETVSTEGIKSIANDIWKAIKDFVKKIWKKVEGFFHNIFGALPRLRKSLVALKERADKMQDKSIDEAKTECGSAANAVAIDYSAPANGAGLENILKDTAKIVDGLFDVYTKAIIDRGEHIKKGLKDYKPTKDWKEEQHGKALSKIFDWKADWSNITKCFGAVPAKHKDGRFSTEVDVGSVMMPGNMALYVQQPNDTTSAILSRAEARRGRTVRIMSSRDRAQDAIDEHEIQTLSVGEIKAVADACIEIVDGIESWERGKNIGKVKDLVKDIEAAGDSLKKAEDKLDDVPSDVRAYPRSAMNFVKSFTTWGSEPHASVTSVALAAVRASIVICNKSLSNYK